MEDTFICYMCEEEFDKGWSDEEAESEARENFGENAMESPNSVVCDDCYKNLMRPANG